MAAFVGWQVRTAVGMSSRRPPSFKQYLAQLGIKDERLIAGAALRAERERGARNAAAVRDAFASGRMRKQ